jgi:hypothetical protein
MTLYIKSIPATAELLNVEGVPVVLDRRGNTCLAWDSDPPRKFKLDLAIHYGVHLSRAEFTDLIANPY